MQDWVFGQILAMLLVLGPPSALFFSWTPIGRAITQRIKGGDRSDGARLDDVHAALSDLNEMMDRVGAELEDVRDRLSFAERLLTTGVEREKELTPV